MTPPENRVTPVAPSASSADRAAPTDFPSDAQATRDQPSSEQTGDEARVLLIDDDVEVTGVVKVWLEKHGFLVDTASDGQAGLRLLYKSHPDLVVLDVSMPRIDGWEVCRRIRDLDEVPIIMLTARSETASRVRGFDLGADDYVTKPFELPELLARIRAILRRARVSRTDPDYERQVVEGDLTVDIEAHRVTVAGRLVELSPTEFRLLAFLARNRGKVLTHSQILASVWGPDYREQVAYVKLYVRYLREKLESDPANPRLITTERGFGYRFSSPQSRVREVTSGARSRRDGSPESRSGLG